MAPLPNNGVSTPIIVGNRVFLTSEVCDLVCLDKATGRILWIRSNPEFEALSEEERKADPAYAEKLAPLSAEMAKANAAAVEALNARLPTAITAGSSKKQEAALNKKRDLDKQIQEAQNAIDKKRFNRYWGQAVFGFCRADADERWQACLRFLHHGRVRLLRSRREPQMDRGRHGRRERAREFCEPACSARTNWSSGRTRCAGTT